MNLHGLFVDALVTAHVGLAQARFIPPAAEKPKVAPRPPAKRTERGRRNFEQAPARWFAFDHPLLGRCARGRFHCSKDETLAGSPNGYRTFREAMDVKST